MDSEAILVPLVAKQSSLPSLSSMSNQSYQTDGNDSPQSSSMSLAAILATFVPSLVTALFFLSVFIVIRKHYRRIYAPRTYIDVIPEKDRTPLSSTARFEWFHSLWTLGDKFILEHSSLDAYLYLRFLRTAILICFVGSCVTWSILFPINATGGGDASELDKLGFGNVRSKERLYAHAVVAWIFFGFVMWLVASERMWLIGLRQAWYLQKSNAARLSSRTVLYLDPPKSADSDGDAQSNFGAEARRQWIVTNTDKLDKLVEERNSKAMKLESTQVSFLRKANKKTSKLVGARGTFDEQAIDDLRPRQKLSYFTGKEVDGISHIREKVTHAAHEVEEHQDSYSVTSRSRSAIFVEYTDQPAAQRAYRGDSRSRLPVPVNLAVQSRLIGVVPKEIIWGNLAMPQAERVSRKSVANAVIAALIIFWSIPIAFVGSISNVSYLADTFEWLHWMKNLPKPILGLLTGLIPPFVTSLLASYLPNIMRYIAKMSGEPTIVSVELQVQAWYYAFQIIQVFLVTALSSSATAFIPKIINKPHQVPQFLAESIPKSSNFYLTYFILQGLGSSAKNVLNYSDLLQYIFYDKFINKTPRQKYEQYTSLKGIGWGKVYPKFTNFVIIALVYSCISPLVLGFATVGLSLFYLSYRYNLLFVVQPKIDTKGKCYTRALEQILTGVYIGELCLIGLFGLRKAKGPTVMLGILFIGTIVYNVVTNRYFKPLEDHFPDEILSEHQGESEPFLQRSRAVTGSFDDDDNENEADPQSSRVQRIGQEMHIPWRVLDPVTRFLEPQIYASHKAMKAFLDKNTTTTPGHEAVVPGMYSEEDLTKAYVNPSLTSKTPKIWLPSDSDKAGLSKKEIEANEKEEIPSTDEGAWVDNKGKVGFEMGDLNGLPVAKHLAAY